MHVYVQMLAEITTYTARLIAPC